MKLLFLLLIFISPSSFAKTGEIIGYEKMDQRLQSLLPDFVTPTTPLYTLFNMKEPPFGLISLLGDLPTFSFAPNTELVNVTPNPLNSILWQTLFFNLSQNISLSCDKPKTSILGQDFFERLEPLCSWPLPAAQDLTAYKKLFLYLSQFHVPLSELKPWYEAFVTSGAYSNEPREVFIRDLFFAFFMNPYFLLQQ